MSKIFRFYLSQEIEREADNQREIYEDKDRESGVVYVYYVDWIRICYNIKYLVKL